MREALQPDGDAGSAPALHVLGCELREAVAVAFAVDGQHGHDAERKARARAGLSYPPPLVPLDRWRAEKEFSCFFGGADRNSTVLSGRTPHTENLETTWVKDHTANNQSHLAADWYETLVRQLEDLSPLPHTNPTPSYSALLLFSCEFCVLFIVARVDNREQKLHLIIDTAPINQCILLA